MYDSSDVYYIKRGKEHGPTKEGDDPHKPQNRCTRREADSNPAHGGFKIHQGIFQPTFCRAENPQKERPGRAHHHELQDESRSGADSGIL